MFSYFKVILLIITIISLLGAFIKYRMRSQRIRKLLRKFDGPRSFPFVGDAYMFFGCSSTDIFRAIEEQVKIYGEKPFRIWNFHKPYVILNRPDDIQVTMRTLQKDVQAYKFFSEAIGNGLITSGPVQWKRSRALVNPAFNTTIIANHYLHIFNKQNYKLIETLRNEIGMHKSFDVSPYILATTYASIHESILGYDESINNDTYSKLQDITTRLADLIVQRVAFPWLQPSFALKIYLYASGCPNLYKDFRDFYTQAIIKKRRRIEEMARSDQKRQDERKYLIDVLLETNSFSDQELTDEVMTMLAAGSETTGTTVAFTLLKLAQNQEIQEKVYREVYEIFGDRDKFPDANELSQLPFLEQCIKETLRMYPTVRYVLRQPMEDITIIDGKIIPAGVPTVMSINALHHNSKFYANPHTWNPDNFSPENVEKRPGNVFIPFGSGPRVCIGYKYAMISMKALLSTFIRHFKISTKKTEVKLNVSFLTRSADGLHIELTERLSNNEKN